MITSARNLSHGVKKTLRLVLFMFILCHCAPVFAQQVYPFFRTDTSVRVNFSDSKNRVKHFGRAAIEFGLMEVGIWSFDRYLKKAEYANISFKSLGYNLSPGHWAWDNDAFETNQFGHPYHGNFFFNAFRTNGYNFWQSAPAVVVGSYIWETMAENQAPSTNDFINTSFGGIVLGEMTYRLSNKIISNRSYGFKRQLSEVIALLINPMNGVNRILDGKWGKVRANSRRQDSAKISTELDAGLRRYNVNHKTGRFGMYGRINLLYGNPYENYRQPFSNIAITTEFGKDDSSKINIVSVYGSLAGWEIRSGRGLKHLAILSANYDFISNEAFFYGGQSVKMNFISQFDQWSNLKLNASVGAGPIILAAMPDPYKFDGRDYDYGSGVALNGGARLSIFNHLFYSANYRGSWTRTINGNQSHHFLHTFSNELSYKILGGFSLAAEAGYFTLRGYYKNYPDVDQNYPYLRVSARYTIDP